MAETPLVLQVDLRDQTGLVFSGSVKALSSQNSAGSFDILPLHAHFITIVQDEIRLTTMAGAIQKFAIKQGVLRCFDNKVEVFTGLESSVTAAQAETPKKKN